MQDTFLQVTVDWLLSFFFCLFFSNGQHVFRLSNRKDRPVAWIGSNQFEPLNELFHPS